MFVIALVLHMVSYFSLLTGWVVMVLALMVLLANILTGSTLEDVYIPYRKYQDKPHSSRWFSAVCSAGKIYRNHFFCLYQQNQPSESKVSSDRLVVVAKGFLKLPYFTCATKTKET